jgi:hypothetical protein
MLADAGLQVIACETLIHNPRIVSRIRWIVDGEDQAAPRTKHASNLCDRRDELAA